MTIQRVLMAIYVIIFLINSVSDFLESGVIFSPRWLFDIATVLLGLYFIRTLGDAKGGRCALEQRLDTLEREQKKLHDAL